MAGMRWWICLTNVLDGTVMIAKVRSHSPVFGLRQQSGEPERRTVLHRDGIRLLGTCAFNGRHSKKPSTGTMQRR